MAPNLAIGLSILLAVIILLGLFYKDTDVKWIKYIFVAVGAIAFIVVAYSSLSQYGSSNSFLWQQYGSALIVLVILGIIIGFAVKDK
jgi:O-antigen/teichoic acid export membrane protein